MARQELNNLQVKVLYNIIVGGLYCGGQQCAYHKCAAVHSLGYRMHIDSAWDCKISTKFCTTTPHHNRSTTLFPGPPGWAGAGRELLDFMVKGKINRGRHTDHPAGRHSIRTNQCPPPPSLIFYRPDALPASQPTVSKHWRQQVLDFALSNKWQWWPKTIVAYMCSHPTSVRFIWGSATQNSHLTQCNLISYKLDQL